MDIKDTVQRLSLLRNAADIASALDELRAEAGPFSERCAKVADALRSGAMSLPQWQQSALWRELSARTSPPAPSAESRRAQGPKKAVAERRPSSFVPPVVDWASFSTGPHPLTAPPADVDSTAGARLAYFGFVVAGYHGCDVDGDVARLYGVADVAPLNRLLKGEFSPDISSRFPVALSGAMIAGAGAIEPRWETLMRRLFVDAGLEALGFPYEMPADSDGPSRRASWLAKRLLACRWSGLLADGDIKRPWSADLLERVARSTGELRGLSPQYTDALLDMSMAAMKDAFPSSLSSCVPAISCVALQAGAMLFSVHSLI